MFVCSGGTPAGRRAAHAGILAKLDPGPDPVAGHRDRAHGVAAHEGLGADAFLGRQAGNIEQGHEMVGRGHGERVIGMLDHLERVARIAGKLIDNRIVEPLRPVVGQIGLVPLEPPRLWTTLPLARIITPRSRSGASRRARSR
jgi:hypothetical protein